MGSEDCKNSFGESLPIPHLTCACGNPSYLTPVPATSQSFSPLFISNKAFSSLFISNKAFSPLFISNKAFLILTLYRLLVGRCAFFFHSLVICRHSYACWCSLLLSVSPRRLLCLPPPVLSTAMESFQNLHPSKPATKRKPQSSGIHPLEGFAQRIYNRNDLKIGEIRTQNSFRGTAGLSYTYSAIGYTA